MEMFTNKGAITNEICKVCLSTDRNVTPIGKYLDLFTKICRKLKPSYKTNDLLICWECRALLRKVEQFQLKVSRAQDYFKNAKALSTESILNQSTLQVIRIQNDETNVIFFTESSTETICKEVTCAEDIKKEYDDFKFDDSFADDGSREEETQEGDDVSIKDEKLDINQELLDLFKINDVTKIKSEIDNDYNDFLYLENFAQKKKVKKKKIKIKENRRPYKVVYGDKGSWLSLSKLFKRVPIDKSELFLLREKERNMEEYTKMTYKCESCIIGYQFERTYLKHMDRHNKKRKYECEICTQRFDNKTPLSAHCRAHFVKHACAACAAACLRARTIRTHVRHAHARSYQCASCARLFLTKSEAISHYKTHVEFICDHCGKKSSKKSYLERHMRVQHLPHICKLCNITFKKYRFHQNHIKEKHVKTRTEEAFCVECNVQFDNVPMYKRHLTTSVKHKPKSDVKYPCPHCNKLFNKKMNMKYHYNYFHTDRTKFYCEPCAKYFLNNYQLRRHKATIHDKIKPVKNKFCPHCGRGFSARRILENHIRTHTGERPFVCALCAAAFTQQYPLTTHMRAVHKMNGKINK